MTRIIHWFRRDLRLHDNTALTAATRDSGGMVIPVFLLDPRLHAPHGRFTSPTRVRFLLDSLRALAHALEQQGCRLVFRRGDPAQLLPELARHADAVYWNRDYSPYARRRDDELAATLRGQGCRVQQFKDAVVWEADEILTRTGGTYSVYTPYARQWHARLFDAGLVVHDVPTLRLPAAELPESEPIPTLDALDLHTDQTAVVAGEAAAHEQLRRFVDGRRTYNVTTYAASRDTLAVPGTSRLSPHLRLGTISPRTCVQVALQQDGTDDGVKTWVGEIAWRDFYAQILATNPHVLRGAFRREYDALQWENDTVLFAAWCAGRTGYPVVDAAMRQLNREGWMHNRARMIVASFLTKDLLVDWRWGERYFMQQLVDGDPASNNGGWQWAAGTGTDAQPYFRIFNPVSQGKKFDPDGAYVRHYLPELADVPLKVLHEPWKMSDAQQRACGVQLGREYPYPVVDHGVQRQKALALYKTARQADSNAELHDRRA